MALKGIVIDAGHGGSDPGAIGNGFQEKVINSMMADYMFNRFNELGVPVKYIRSTDETLSPKERTKQILDAYGNDPNVLVISNHINAGGGEGSCGKLTFFEKKCKRTQQLTVSFLNSLIKFSISSFGILVLLFSFNRVHALIASTFEIILLVSINFIILRVLITSTPLSSEKFLSLLSPVAKIALLSRAII